MSLTQKRPMPVYDDGARLSEDPRMKAAEERARLVRKQFEPYIYVNHSLRTPTSITCAAITGAGWRYLPVLPSILGRSRDAQHGWVVWRVRRHFKENGGKLFLFGNITGYRWYLSATEILVFDCRGKDMTAKA